MTVLELINFLMTQDTNLEVYIEGYEDGYTDVTADNIETIEVCRNFYHDQQGGKDWWYGDHEDYNVVRKGPADLSRYEIKKGIVFTR
jgi:hypothetical protein